MAGTLALSDAQTIPFFNRRFRKRLFRRWFHIVP